jgi:uncharacterized protein (DUF1800 family)
MESKNHFKIKLIHYLSLLAFTLLISKASFAVDSDVFVINSDVGQYLGFNLADGTNAVCDSTAPDWRRVSGLPAGMNRGGCSIYGRPEIAGTFRLEFPVVGGVWLADLVVTSDDDTIPVPPPPIPDVYTITGNVGRYLGFNLADGTNAVCDSTAPDWRRITGLPAGMNRGGCSIYGRPEVAGTFRLEFPVVGGVWLADLVITGDGTPVDPVDPVDPPTSSEIEAARFLAQSTFGATIAEITSLAASGDYEGWIDSQFVLPISSRLNALQTLDANTCTQNEVSADELAAVWWDVVLAGDDQLRQRVAFALSEILVVSKIGDLSKQAIGLADYYDVLTEHAFGNYRDLLRDVTLHPTMGIYLTMFGNRPASGAIRPDENYARELLQLFAIGVNQLNVDGSIILNPEDGSPVPTYTQSTVENFAKVFTGWNLVGIGDYNHGLQGVLGSADMTAPMIASAAYHDVTSEKALLRGTVLPAGQSAEDDLEDAITNVFEHPNVGPFVGKQLIQRLVTSNPSPAYIQRVAQAFNNNGTGERGDLQAVVKAILLDPEARAAHPASDNFGKLREPMLRLSHLRRALGVVPVSGNDGCGDYHLYPMGYTALGQNRSIQSALGQNILHSPSVFNFFLPNYSPPGLVTESNLVAPEFQIATENTMVNLANVIGFELQANSSSFATTINTDDEVVLANDSNVLLNHLNLLLLSGTMSTELRGLLLSLLEDSVYPDNEVGRVNKVKDVITLIVASPDYLIQK